MEQKTRNTNPSSSPRRLPPAPSTSRVSQSLSLNTSSTKSLIISLLSRANSLSQHARLTLLRLKLALNPSPLIASLSSIKLEDGNGNRDKGKQTGLTFGDISTVQIRVSKDAQRSNGESSRMAFECSELEFSLFDDGFRKVNIRLGFNSGIPQACRRITKQSSDDCIISSSSNCNGTNIHVKNRTNANIRMSFHKGGVQLLEL